MKKLFYISTIFLFVINSFAQDFQGVAYYASQKQMKDFSISGADATPQMNEAMIEKIKKAFEKTFILTFSKTESVFQEEEKLDAPNSSSVKGQPSFSMRNDSKLYKNFIKQQYIVNNDIFGKDFLITDSLSKHDWKLINEQKVIGNYTCYKAQIIIPVTIEETKEYEEFKKKQEENKTSFFTLSEPKEQIIEAWYTLDIPVSNGPSEYWGLPGLILELHDNGTTYLCNKIILNPKEKLDIKAPKNGKKVTQKEFDVIQEKKMNSMMDENGAIEIRTN